MGRLRMGERTARLRWVRKNMCVYGGRGGDGVIAKGGESCSEREELGRRVRGIEV
jgi:hypothetical protein